MIDKLIEEYREEKNKSYVEGIKLVLDVAIPIGEELKKYHHNMKHILQIINKNYDKLKLSKDDEMTIEVCNELVKELKDE